MFEQRASGILLHPTSVPAQGGIGDLGPSAYQFIDFLAAARQTLWQVLPLGPPGYGYSPYSSTSAFAGSVLMISLDRLAERGWIDRSRIAALPDSVDRVDYERVRATKVPVLEEAARNFLKGAKADDRRRFEKFCWENGWWLEDFVLFDALRRRHNRDSWNRWPRELALREPAALDRARKELAEELNVGRFLQFAFLEQWRSLRAYCGLRGIKIVGDIAIFVSYDSADVWTHPDVFQLDRDGNPEVVAGVPPDAFSQTGQRWGNPLYRWDALRDRGYDWWVQRVRWALMLCDYIRLDHFRGFQACWEIPASEPTAVNGRWAPGPGEDLFDVFRRQLGDLPFIAEDLGIITQDVCELRERLKIPGMRVMQFGFDNPGAHIYLPHKFEPNTVVYTGTHDNDTTPGWWKNGTSDETKRFAIAYLGQPEDGMHWAMIRAAEDSVARLCIIPLQDVLGLGSDARMNIPSSSNGNWSWRYKPGSLKAEIAQKLALLMETCDRGGPPAQIPESKEYFAA
jgi:4-alpha-glucanotransferase